MVSVESTLHYTVIQWTQWSMSTHSWSLELVTWNRSDFYMVFLRMKRCYERLPTRWHDKQIASTAFNINLFIPMIQFIS